ncbi:MAG: hypothetical protein IJ127_25505 [Afipia sp.]|jgi:hypothetical protein|nr:hypothetical protein [Afipia sp.]MBS4003378.1 hypothetical protein [Afipia sp.]MBS4006483.1 hypothetical protein [Afipia sp.]
MVTFRRALRVTLTKHVCPHSGKSSNERNRQWFPPKIVFRHMDAGGKPFKDKRG